MGARGPKSTSELTVLSFGTKVRRPDPPAELTEEQAAEWRAVVNRLSAGHFPRETHAMLAAYCRHVVTARRVAQVIDALEKDTEFNAAEYYRALKAQDAEGRAISSLAGRMRFSQISTIPHKLARKPSMEKNPWE